MKVKAVQEMLEKANPDSDFKVSVAFDEEKYPLLRVFGNKVHDFITDDSEVMILMSGESNNDFATD